MIYTVIGLINNTECPPTLTVAGVIPGELHCVDTDPWQWESAQRWADSFEATDPNDAEAKAHQQVDGDL